MAQSLWKFGGLTPLRLARRVWREFNQDDILGHAAELSYYFLLALFPMLLFMVNLLGFFAGPGTELRESLFTALGRVLPASASGLIQQTLDEVVRSSTGFKAAIGLLGALWAASAGLRALSNTLNIAYEVKENRTFLKRIALSVSLTVALSVLILSALTLMLYGEHIAEFVSDRLGMSALFTLAWKILQWPLIAGFMLAAFALVLLLRAQPERTYVVLRHAGRGHRTRPLAGQFLRLPPLSAIF